MPPPTTITFADAVHMFNCIADPATPKRVHFNEDANVWIERPCMSPSTSKRSNVKKNWLSKDEMGDIVRQRKKMAIAIIQGRAWSIKTGALSDSSSEDSSSNENSSPASGCAPMIIREVDLLISDEEEQIANLLGDTCLGMERLLKPSLRQLTRWSRQHNRYAVLHEQYHQQRSGIVDPVRIAQVAGESTLPSRNRAAVQGKRMETASKQTVAKNVTFSPALWLLDNGNNTCPNRGGDSDPTTSTFMKKSTSSRSRGRSTKKDSMVRCLFTTTNALTLKRNSRPVVLL